MVEEGETVACFAKGVYCDWVSRQGGGDVKLRGGWVAVSGMCNAAWVAMLMSCSCSTLALFGSYITEAKNNAHRLCPLMEEMVLLKDLATLCQTISQKDGRGIEKLICIS